MVDVSKTATCWLMRGRNALLGLDRYRDPRSYFGPGGLEEVAAVCAEANRDLLGFISPPADVEPRGLRRRRTGTRRDGVQLEDWSFDSPRPSGDAANDRVELRLYRPRQRKSRDRVVLFHHGVYTRRWPLWSWYLDSLIGRVPVAMMAGPYHVGRTGEGRFPGEGTVNPNPARLYESIRQWCWDHEATARALREHAGLRVAAEIGFSLGGFQTLLLASAGRIDVPIVTISATNRYAHGLTHGIIGKGLLRSMRRAGIDEETLFRWTDAVQLERYVEPLHGKPVFYIRGLSDYVDPPPSLDRLEKALQPIRVLRLRTGHGGVLLYRRRIFREVGRFLEEAGALRPEEPPGRIGPREPRSAEF